MVIRELIAKLGFQIDKSSLSAADSAVTGVKQKMGETGDAAIEAGNKASSGFNMLGSAANIARGVVIGLGVAAVGVIHSMVEGTRDAADEMMSLDGRLRVVTDSEKDRLKISQDLYDIAQRTRQPLAETGDLYFSIAKSSQELGVSQKEALQMTETVTKALTVGGAKTEQTQATILQLGQALSSGRLQGDELRSLDENARDLMQAIAEYFGTNVGGLKQLGSQGALTADKVAQAILYAQKQIDWQYTKMPVTIGQALVVISNGYAHLIDTIEKETGIFSTVAKYIYNFVFGIQNNLKWLAGTVGGARNLIMLFTVALGSMAGALAIINFGKIIVGLRAVATAFGVANIAALGKFALIAAAIAAVVLVIQDLYVWMQGGDSLIGDWLGSWDNVRAKLSNIFGPLIQSGQQAISTIQNIGQEFINFIQNSSSVQNFLNTLSQVWQYIKTTLGSIADYLAPIFSGLFDNLATFFGQLTDEANGSGTVLGTIFNGLLDALSAILPLLVVIWGVFVGVFTNVIAIIGFVINEFLELMTTGGYVADAIAAFFQGTFNLLIDIIHFVADVLRGDFSAAINDVESFFIDLYDMVVGVLSNIAAAIGSYILDKLAQAKNAVMDFLGWSSDATNQAISDNRQNYNQNIDIKQTFNGGTAAENNGYMQQSAQDIFSGTGWQYNPS